MACNLRGTRVVPWHVGTDTGVPSTWAPVAWEGDFETPSTSCRDEERLSEMKMYQDLVKEHEETQKTLRLQRSRNVELTTSCCNLRQQVAEMEMQLQQQGEDCVEALDRISTLSGHQAALKAEKLEVQQHAELLEAAVETLQEELKRAETEAMVQGRSNLELKERLGDLELRCEATELDVALMRSECRASEASKQDLMARLQCCVCMEAPRCTLLEPCSHYALCFSCARKMTQCPLCRRNITSIQCTLSG
eukprot:symbB.v1.2.034890.t1/scaffold4584.1/size37672/4